MVELKIKRTDGTVETVDVSNKFGSMNKVLLSRIRQATKEAGRGEVIEAIITEPRCNMAQLVRAYNNLNNEGGGGYIPEAAYFKAMPSYKEWNDISVIK